MKESRYHLHIPVELSNRLERYCERTGSKRFEFCVSAIKEKLDKKEGAEIDSMSGDRAKELLKALLGMN